MAAPSGTSWGSTVGSYGRIGIYTSVSSSATTTSVSVQVWFWSKYTVSDSSNKFYFNTGSSASTSRGSVSIKTTNNSGSGWSTTNQVRLGSYSYSYSRGTSSVSKSFAAKLTGVDVVGGTMTCTKSITVPAKASYTVSYNANGGSGAPSSQTKWYGTNLTLSSTKPTRTGYSFQGWATSSTGAVAYSPGATYTGNAALTLYAVWKANTYTVSYNANGGSGAPSNQTKTYGVNLTLSSTKPTRTDYNFLGWATSSTGAVAYSPGATYTGNAALTLYAVWQLAYKKPRISGFSAQRCTSNGTASETGTYYKVSFNWATDKTVSAVYVQHKAQTATSWTDNSIGGTGLSGAVTDLVFGSGAINTEATYVVRVYVSDSGGTTYSTEITLGTVKFPIDVKAGGTGVAFGKVAELTDYLDSGWKARFRKNIVMNNGTGSDGSGVIYGEDPTTGADIAAFQPQNENGNVVIGHGAFVRKSGHTNIYSGDNIALYPGGNSLSAFYINGETGRGYMQRQTDLGLNFTHATSKVMVGIGVGSGGTNRGVWDGTGGNWIIYRNASNTTVVNTSSDARLKDNLGEISEDEMYTLLSGMEPINFIYKNDENEIVQNGFIAQNVRDLLIDNDIGYRSYLLIKDNTENDDKEDIYDLNADEEKVIYGLDYSKFTPILVSGWQYHEKKIKELEDRIAELENKLGGDR